MRSTSADQADTRPGPDGLTRGIEMTRSLKWDYLDEMTVYAYSNKTPPVLRPMAYNLHGESVRRFLNSALSLLEHWKFNAVLRDVVFA
ncbi:hypothetical protein TWF481_011658 [Arthrobotrys musiformis]|uniref:Uncharacterized protein n=1 Tax=Arthrobotrys musiformis TaxID=47236 RepID=A0AAV9W4Z4_9PEZI